MTRASTGDIVQVRFTCLAADGSMVGIAETDQPLEFRLGSERAITGLNRAIVGMQEGEMKTVAVPVDEGFGPRDAKLVFRVRRAALPNETRVGDRVPAQMGEKKSQVWVTALDNEFATVDANHPLAGQSLVLQIWLIGIRAATGAVPAPMNRKPLGEAGPQTRPPVQAGTNHAAARRGPLNQRGRRR
jgi:peptidylprolyl isomerase